MSTRMLTVAADDELIRKLERMASEQKTDVQSMIARLLERFAAVNEPLDDSQLPPITRSARGLLKDLPDRPYKELLEEALLEKYGFKK